MRRTRTGVISTAVAAGLMPYATDAATVSWTGTGGSSWATVSSWSNGAGPSAADTAAFTDAGSINQPNEVTSVLNATRTIGGLSFSNTLGKFHTLDLGTHTLNVAGNFNFNLDQGANTTTTIRNGSLNVSSPFATVGVGRGVVGSSTAIADLSGASSFTSNTQNFYVGQSTSGTANGTLTLGPSSNITANLIQVGASRGSSGTLHLGGGANAIQAAQWDIARDDANGTVDVVNGGSVSIGTAAQRTALHIANQNSNTIATYAGTLNLGNAAVNLRLDSLVVAQKTGGSGSTFGTLNGGGSGSVVIGDPAARGNVTIGNTIFGGGSNGTVDLSRLGTMQAFVNDVTIGTAASGSATGTLSLAANSSIDASNAIVVGSSGNATLTAGSVTSTLLANELAVGRDYSNATLRAPAGSTLNLGSPSRRVSLSLANSTANTNETYTARIDATGATLNAHLSGLIVGQRTAGGGGGTSTGTIFGATGGSVEIGAPGTNTANVIIGNNAGTGTGPASGSVDFGGLASFTANLNTLSLGTSPSSSGTQGSLVLGATNTINANSVVVGSNGGGSNSLTLGQNNTILTNQLTIAKDFASGSVTLPANGTLNLGSPTQRANVSIATGTTNTLNNYLGTLDTSAGTLVAYLGNVVVGDKNPQPGSETGTISLSSKSGNYVDANSIALGGTNSTGTINFAGGRLLAGTISAGAGTANFNWSGGQFSVGTFGTPTRAFHLNNTGTGTLAPGSAAAAIGATQVYGNYTQASSAATALEVAGVSSGTGNDQLNVSGSATLAGTLSVDFVNGYTPAAGQNILLATYGSRSGTYGFVDPPTGMPQNVAFQLDYTTAPTQLMMRMVAPTAQNWTSTASQGTWSVGSNWTGGAAPTTSTNATVANNTANPQTVSVASSTTAHRVTLQGTTAPLNFEVLQGVRLGVANELVVGSNAALTGGGQVLGNLTVLAGGSIAPGQGVGALAVDGNVSASGRLAIEIAGPPNGGGFDSLNVSGSAALGGAITLSNVNGNVPAKTDVYPVLTYGSRGGRFDPLALTASAPGQSYSLYYGADGVSVLAGEWDSPANIGGEFDVPGNVLVSDDWHWSGLLVKRGAGTLTLDLGDDFTTGPDASLAIVSGTVRLDENGGRALELSGLSFGDLGQLSGDPDLNGTFGFYYASVSAVPEPATLAALSLLATLGLGRRRKRR